MKRLRRYTCGVLAAVLLAAGFAAPATADTNPKGLNQWELRALPDNAAQVHDLGVGIVRVDLPWQQVEPNPQQLVWKNVDTIVQTARTNGIAVLFTLRSISSWGTSIPAAPRDLYHHASLPKSMADWQRFVGAVASRYAGQGVSYEIENEVDTNFWAGTLADYLALLKASYAAIKAADPKALVLHSALGCGIVFDQETNSQQRYQDRADGG